MQGRRSGLALTGLKRRVICNGRATYRTIQVQRGLVTPLHPTYHPSTLPMRLLLLISRMLKVITA